MAKEFDIYLNRRVAECDLLVRSLPFRDGLTADNKVVVDACIEAYTLYKFAATQLHSNLTAHIDEMLKTCYEMLGMDVNICLNAAFQVHYIACPSRDNIVELSCGDISALTAMFARAENAVRIGIEELEASIGKSVGSGNSEMIVSSKITDALKRGMLSINSQLPLESSISEVNEQNFIICETSVEPTAMLERLCYRITDAASTAIELAALVLGTEIHYSFGRAYVNMEFDSSVQDVHTTKSEIVQGAFTILAEMAESIKQYMQPERSTLRVFFAAEPVLKRPRLLSELDDALLSSIDEMALEDLYYVTLDV